MNDSNQQLDTLLAALEDKKKTIQAAALVAKNDFLDALDTVEETVEDKIDDIDTDSLKMRLLLVKLKVLEEWDEIEEKLESLGGNAKEMAKSSETEISETWSATKKIAGDIEQRISKFFTKNT